MLLAFDVGNTNIVLGVFKDGKMITNWRLETDNRKSADEYGMIINQLFQYEKLDFADVEDVIIATVVPSILYTLQHLSQKYFNTRAIVIGPGIKTGLIVKYDNPRSIDYVGSYSVYHNRVIFVDTDGTTYLAKGNHIVKVLSNLNFRLLNYFIPFRDGETIIDENLRKLWEQIPEINDEE